MANNLRVLDVCSGIGGFTLAHEMVGGFETVAFCEQDTFCHRVLKTHWPDVPIFDDIKTLRSEDIGTANVICGGIPCQPFSGAGQRRGADDDRHLWPEFLRLVGELRPNWCLIENVAGFVPMALDGVLSDLESHGYAAQAFVVPDCAVNAPHRRDRVWVVAYSDGSERRAIAKGRAESKLRGWRSAFTESGRAGQHIHYKFYSVCHNPNECDGQPASCWLEKARLMGDANVTRQREPQGRKQEERRRLENASGWNDSEWLECADGKARRVKSGVRLLANGIPGRVDKLRALGNAIVPQVAARFFYAIRESHYDN